MGVYRTAGNSGQQLRLHPLRPILWCGLGLLLAGCPKQASTSASVPEKATDVWAEEDKGPPDPAKGWRRIDHTRGVGMLRPATAMAWSDGSLWVAGSAVKIAQYQWVLRIPQFGDATQHIYDPGRVLSIRDDGSGNVVTCGVLGGVPEDKAWFGGVDAFGGLADRQTYLSDGNGALTDVSSNGKQLALVGHMASDDSGAKGWMILTDAIGRDVWKKEFGSSFTQSLDWVHAENDLFVSVGYQQDETTDPWLLVVDGQGEALVSKRWNDNAFTSLTTAVWNKKGNDLIALGLSASTQDGHLDGDAGLWSVRVNIDGTATWDRTARGDLSALGEAVPWKDGAAVAALVGPLGSKRTVAVAMISGDGTITWSTPDLPPGIDLAELYINNGKLQIIATTSDEWGVSWTSQTL